MNFFDVGVLTATILFMSLGLVGVVLLLVFLNPGECFFPSRLADVRRERRRKKKLEVGGK